MCFRAGFNIEVCVGEVTWCLSTLKYTNSSPLSPKKAGRIDVPRSVKCWWLHGDYYPVVSTSVHVWNWKVWGWGMSVWRSWVPPPLLTLTCLFPRVAKMAPSCSRLPFHLLGNPMGKRMSPSQPFQQRSKGSLFLIGQEDIVSLSPSQSQWPRDCSVLTAPETLAHLDWEGSQGGSLKGKWECSWLRKWGRMLGRHNCRHALLLWNRGHSPLKVIVRRLKVILVSGTNNELLRQLSWNILQVIITFPRTSVLEFPDQR